MKNSFIIIFFFIAGIICGFFDLLPGVLLESKWSIYALYVLMFLVGVGVGSDSSAWKIMKKVKVKILLVPLSVIAGTFMGVAVVSLFIDQLSVREALAVGSGFGYYSLSSIFITHISGETLGVIALLSNIFREITTLLAAPFFVRYFGKLAPIASGGATAMDTTLPVIAKSSGREYAIIAVFSGTVLTILVPFLITIILDVSP